jgi:hypothetical protein
MILIRKIPFKAAQASTAETPSMPEKETIEKEESG